MLNTVEWTVGCEWIVWDEHTFVYCVYCVILGVKRSREVQGYTNLNNFSSIHILCWYVNYFML